MSEMVPPASVNGAEPKNPQRKREARRHPMFGASAQGMLKMIYTRVGKIHSRRRPSSSERGDQSNGPVLIGQLRGRKVARLQL